MLSTLAMAVSLAGPPAGPLVADLAAPDFRRRRAARQHLVDLGPAAVPALRLAAGHDDPNVAAVAPVLLAEIGAGRAATGPTRVTLNLVGVDAKQAVARLAEAAGLAADTDSCGCYEPRAVTLELRDAPFWRAAALIEDRGGIEVGVEDGVVTVDSHGTYRPDAPPPVIAEAGPVGVEPVAVVHTLTTTRTGTGDAEEERRELELRLRPDPRFEAYGQPALTVTRLDGPGGEALLGPAPPRDDHHFYHHDATRTVPLARADLRPARIAGTVIAAIPARTRTLAQRGGEPAEVTVEGTTLRLGPWREDGDGFAADVAIVNAGPISGESTFLDGLRAFDADGGLIEVLPGGSDFEMDTRTYTYRAGSRPARFVWEFPTALDERRFEFEAALPGAGK